ncbi:hypothetical protein ACN47E_005663 [Coniothyrium glycines]
MQSHSATGHPEDFTFIRESEWFKSHTNSAEDQTFKSYGSLMTHLKEQFMEGYRQASLPPRAGHGSQLSALPKDPPNDMGILKRWRKDVTNSLRYEMQQKEKQISQYGESTYSEMEQQVLNRYGLADRLALKGLNRLCLKFRIPYNERYNDWRIAYDDDFAKSYCSTSPVVVPTAASKLCVSCRNILLKSHGDEPVVRQLAEYIEIATNCRICQLIVRAFAETADETGFIRMFCSRSALRAELGGRRLLRLSASPDSAGNLRYKIPIGHPILPDRDCAARFHLLRAWLRHCDQTHSCNTRFNENTAFPTRVIDVRGVDDETLDPGWIRLVDAAERTSDSFVALSHCWGPLSDAQKQDFCTSAENLPHRRHRFHVSELPRTFQDAIKVTRAIVVPYLWIDSICIIQYGDDKVDWNREAIRMEDVFSGAYCTIAATAAMDSYSGFLERSAATEYIRVQNGAEEQFFISTDVDDFDHDVVESKLNSRAWVFQESVLSRRTIHFSANQIYWECGEGVYCENLTKLTSLPVDRYFLMDPMFPSRLLQQSPDLPTEAFRLCAIFLFEAYSKRQITFAKDRPVAIAALEQRIADAFACDSRHGVLESNLHYNLLWCAAGERPASLQSNDAVPSWSWISYPGPVRIQQGLDVVSSAPLEKESLRTYIMQMAHEGYKGTAGLDVNVNVTFRHGWKNQLNADLAKLVNCTIHPREASFLLNVEVEFDHVLHSTPGKLVGWIAFDAKETPGFDRMRCVVLARLHLRSFAAPLQIEGAQYLFMAVTSAGNENEYRRIGIGMASQDHFVKLENCVQIV